MYLYLNCMVVHKLATNVGLLKLTIRNKTTLVFLYDCFYYDYFCSQYLISNFKKLMQQPKYRLTGVFYYHCAGLHSKFLKTDAVVRNKICSDIYHTKIT